MAALPLRMRKNILLNLSAIIIFYFIGVLTAHSAQVTLSWDPITEPEVAGYMVYYGTASRSYQNQRDAGLNTTYTVANLPEGGTYFFAVTAYDSYANESDFSAEVSYPASLVCSLTVSPISQSVPSTGGTGIVSVTATSGCSWTAVSNASWLLITSNSTGAGNGAVNYSVLANLTNASRSGTMTVAAKVFTVTQNSAPQFKLSVTKNGTGTGSIANTPAGNSFSAGTVIALTATSDVNSTFAGWSGGCSGASPTCKIMVNSNISVAANFTRRGYTITAVAGENGSITPSGSVIANYGESKTFTITPAKGHKISDVKVDGVSVGTPSALLFGNVRADHKIEATFTHPKRWHKGWDKR